MNINELMIDDWVLDTFDKPMKVRDIITFDNKYSAKRYVNVNSLEGGGVYSQREGNIKPIPLTAEILEKNEFEYDHYYHNWIYNEFTINYGHLIDEDDGDYLFIWVADTSVKLTYVHELQQALRLCRLNDLANNLKV